MADSINVKIGVDGEAQFKAAIANITQQSKELAAEMKAVTSGMASEDKQMEVLGRQMETQRKLIDALNTKYDAQKKAVDQTRAALEKAKAEFGENSTQAQKLQTELLRQETQLSKTKTQINNAEAAYNNMATQVDHLGDELDDATEKQEKSKKSLKDIAGSIGKAAAAGIAAIGAAAVAAGKPIWDMANQVAATGDEIDKMSQKIGISTQAYQEWAYVFERSGADVNNLQAGMKTLSGVIVDAGNGSATAAEKLAAVGLSLEELNGLSQEQQLEKVVAALQNMGEGSERTAAATDLLGRSATDMAAVLNMTAEETEALKQEAEDYGMVMSDDAVAASAAFQDSLTRLNGTIAGVKNRLVGQLLPGITKLTDGLALLASGSEEAAPMIQEAMSEIFASLTEMIPQFIGFIQMVALAVLENAPMILEGLMTGIIEAIPQLIPVVMRIIAQIIMTLISELPNIITAAMEIIVSIVQGIAQMLPELIPAMVDVMITIVTTMIDNLDMIIEAALELIIALAEGLIAALPKLIEAVPTIITKLVVKLTDPQMMAKIVKAALQLIIGLGKGLIQAIPTLLKSVGQIGSAVWEGLTNAFSAIWQIGDQIVSGIWNGISNGLQWIKNKISGWVGNVLSFIKGLFGIKSPSKVMRDQVGVYLAEGIGVGFTDEMKTVRKEMANAIPMNFDTAINANLNAGASASDAVISGRASGGTSQAFTINVYGAEGQNVDDLANAVSLKIQQKFVRKEAVWA